MSATVEEDFAGFVAARWSDLETVALVATLDPAAASRLTATALASLRAGWERTVEDGAPTAAARAALLERIAEWSTAAPAGSVDLALLGAVDSAGDQESSVPAGLLRALAVEEPMVRGVLAAVQGWEVTESEVTALAGPRVESRAGRGAAGLTERLVAARARLLDAHRAALATDGRCTADHLLDADLAALVGRLAAVQPSPPDPRTLVAAHTGRTRRRTLLLAGTGAAALGATGWVALRARPGATAPARTRSPSASVLADDAAQWGSTSQWPPRGELGGDGGVRSLVAEAGLQARVLFAGDVEGLRVVLASTPREADAGSTVVRVWAGPVGTPPKALEEVSLVDDTVRASTDAVALALPAASSTDPTGSTDSAGSVVLLLTGPRWSDAELSPVVRLTRAGRVLREFTRVPLDQGAGSLRWDTPLGRAALVRLGTYAGPVLSPRTWGSGSDGGVGGNPGRRLLATLVDHVASATGLAPGQLRGDLLVDSPVDGSVLDALVLSASGADGRVLLARVRTPDGAVVRSLEVTDDGRSRAGSVLLTPPSVVPAREATRPVVLRLADAAPRTGRYLVLAPGGAATCQLIATNAGAYPISKVVRLKGETAVVPVVNADDAGRLRLVLKDARGRPTFDDVAPPLGRDLDDLEAPETGWLGLPRPYGG